MFSVAPVGRPVIGEQLIDRRTDAISMANDSVSMPRDCLENA